MPLPLSQISLRQRERGFVLGGTEAGKSYLADYLGQDFVARYEGAGGRRLILDSKPRYRAQWMVNGLSAARRYRRWSHGEAVPGSVLVEHPDQLERAFRMGSTAIAQGERSGDVAQLVACASRFVDDSRASRPQLLQVDELMDFYHGNGSPRLTVRGDDPIVRAVRAGRERGTACLYCSQRTKGIPAQVMQELAKCYLFLLDNEDDAKRLQEMGAPRTMIPPRRERMFLYWTKLDRARIYGPYFVDSGRA